MENDAPDKVCYKCFNTAQVTDAMLEEGAALFTGQYGVWGVVAAERVGGFARAGSRVRLTATKLRNDYLSPTPSSNNPTTSHHYVSVRVTPSVTSSSTATATTVLAGHAIASRWVAADGRTICWVTQLVVHRAYRGRGLATGLLTMLRSEGDDVYGVLSSHAGACMAAAKAFGRSIDGVSLSFIKNNAEAVMRGSPVAYVREARLQGTLFESSADTGGMVCGADTGFFVDHAEPREALGRAKEERGGEWPLGSALLEGCEFLLIVPARGRR